MIRRIMAFVMMIVYLINILLPVQKIYADEENTLERNFVGAALEWLVSGQNKDGSWGNNNYELNTYETLKVLQGTYRNQYNTSYIKGIQWAKQQKEGNTDYLARKSVITEFYQEKDSLPELQNLDGGFGISPNFQSDIMDTLLSLESLLQKDNVSEEAIQKGIFYIIDKQREDGGFSFETSDKSSALLTAQVVLMFNKYMQVNGGNVIAVQESQRKAAQYLQQELYYENNSVPEGIAFIQAYRALLKVKGVQHTTDLEQRLYGMQSEDGSIFNDCYATALYVEAVDERRNMPDGVIEFIDLFSINGESEEKTTAFNADEQLKYVLNGKMDEGTEVSVFITSETEGVVYQNDSLEGVWNIEDIAPGKYTLHGQILDKTYRNVIVEEQQQFQIMPTVVTKNMEVLLTTDAAIVGESVETTLKNEFTYKGNINGTVSLKTQILRDDNIVEVNEKTVEIEKTQEEYQAELITFVPDTSEEGNYRIVVQLYYEDKLLSEANTEFSVRKSMPNTKADFLQSMDKTILYPGKDNLVATFGLEGKQIGEQTISPLQSLKKFYTDNLIRSSQENSSFIYNNGLLYNDYIELYTGNGKYSVGTREGDPETQTDNNKKLIYGHPGGNTSYVTLNIDDNISIYNPNVKATTVDLEKGSLLTEQLWNDKIRITQENTIISNSVTGREDIVEMKYTVTNEDVEKHNVGMRIMMDTQLGDNDHAPFRVPGIGGLTTERELTGVEIPQYYQVFDNINNPSVVAQGTLYLEENNRPDKVQFVNWRKASDNSWNCLISTGAIGDSAVNIYWNPLSLEAGETREYTTYYGCGELNQGIEGNLSVGVTGVTKLEAEEGRYTPNPFLVTAYTCNMGSNTMEGVEGKIVLPNGLSLARGEEEVKSFGDLLASCESQNSWNVIANPSIIDRNLVYSVVFSINGQEVKTVNRKLFVPKLSDNIAAKDIVLETTIDSKYLSIDEEKCNPVPENIIIN